VQVGSNTEPDLIVMNIGPKGDTGATGNTGATGPAGPNSVTSATTSDGTANLSLGDLEVVGGEIYTDGEYSHIYTQGDGAEIFTIGTDAIIYTQGADAHISTSGDSATIYTSGASGSIYTTGANAGISTVGANATMGTQGTNATISTAGSAAHIQTSHASAAVKSTNFAAVESGGASLVDGSMQPCLTWSAGGRNLTIPSGTATTFNTTSYTYGTGAAAAHRTALGLTTLATTTPAANVATFLETPTSANLAAAVTDETGSGSLVFGTSPTLTVPAIRQNNASFTPLALGTYVATFADNTDAVSGVQMGNISTGTSADFRFLIKDTTSHYFAFAQPSVNNSFTLFGVTRSTADFIFNSGGTTRDIIIGTADAKYLALGTNNIQRVRITSSGEVGIGTTTPTATLDVNSNTVRVRTARTPASASATGNAGDICWDANYIYVCTATNTWKRTLIATWI
jgi:hypothetical protein